MIHSDIKNNRDTSMSIIIHVVWHTLSYGLMIEDNNEKLVLALCNYISQEFGN